MSKMGYGGPSDSFLKALNEVRQSDVNVNETDNNQLVEFVGVSAPEEEIRAILQKLRAEAEAYNKSGAVMLKQATDERIGHLEQALAAHCAKKGNELNSDNVWAAAYPKRGGRSSTVPPVDADIVTRSVKVVASEGEVPYKDGAPGEMITNDKRSAVGGKPSQIISSENGAIKKPFLAGVTQRLTNKQ